MVPQTIRDRIDTNLDEFIRLAGREGRIVKKPNVVFDNSSRRAGFARGGNLISLSTPLLMQASTQEEMLWDTLGHEFCHILVSQHPDLREPPKRVFGKMKRVSHGPTFYSWCRKMGVADTRCHTMSIEGEVARPRKSRKTKKERCLLIYSENRGRLSRGEIIERYMNELGMSKAGASTYYQNCKKLYGD